MEASAPGPPERQPAPAPGARRGMPAGLPGEGWALFAGVWFLVIGVFNVIQGIAGIAEDDLFTDDNLFFASLVFWGWIILIIGALQVLTSVLIFNRSVMGQMLGIALAVLGVFAHLFWIAAFPFWSVIAIVISALVIYGLTVHGDQFE